MVVFMPRSWPRLRSALMIAADWERLGGVTPQGTPSPPVVQSRSSDLSICNASSHEPFIAGNGVATK
jgi:hypothetical protein